MGDIKTKSTGYSSLFSLPRPTPLWSQFAGHCFVLFEKMLVLIVNPVSAQLCVTVTISFVLKSLS